MARTIVFPSRSNLTFRAGFVKLTAFGSEFDQAAIEGHTENVVNKLKETARVITPDFEGGGMDYLENAIQNMKTARAKMPGTVKFIAILPLPLAINDTTSLEWSPADSAFVDGAYGKIRDTGIGQASTWAAGASIFNHAGGLAGHEQLGTNALNWLNSSELAFGSGNNVIVENIITGAGELSKAIAASPQVQAAIKPGVGTKQIMGMNSDRSLMTFHNEAAALNGVRQIIFDPGYWAEFKGVTPREFELSWEIIPENHNEAINGLELCSRLREYSLPQSVSGVELLSPCYWWIDWSNKHLDSQTLYSNLVITNVKIDYAQNGEWHGSSTPKMFRITISFKEAKAPTCDIYKNGDSFIPVSTSARGVGGVVKGSTGGEAGSVGNGINGTISVPPNVPPQGFPSIDIPTSPTSGPVISKPLDDIFNPGEILGDGKGSVFGTIKTQISSALGTILGKIGLSDTLGDMIEDALDMALDKILKSIEFNDMDKNNTGNIIKSILDNLNDDDIKKIISDNMKTFNTESTFLEKQNLILH